MCDACSERNRCVAQAKAADKAALQEAKHQLSAAKREKDTLDERLKELTASQAELQARADADKKALAKLSDAFDEQKRVRACRDEAACVTTACMRRRPSRASRRRTSCKPGCSA